VLLSIPTQLTTLRNKPVREYKPGFAGDRASSMVDENNGVAAELNKTSDVRIMLTMRWPGGYAGGCIMKRCFIC